MSENLVTVVTRDILDNYDEYTIDNDTGYGPERRYTYKVDSKYSIEIVLAFWRCMPSDSESIRNFQLRSFKYVGLDIIDLNTGFTLELSHKLPDFLLKGNLSLELLELSQILKISQNLPDFILNSNLLLEIERNAINNNLIKTDKFSWDIVSLSSVRDFLTEVFGDMNKKEVISAGAHCCVCGALEEYAKPDKEGKVYCYLHCY